MIFSCFEDILSCIKVGMLYHMNNTLRNIVLLDICQCVFKLNQKDLLTQ